MKKISRNKGQALVESVIGFSFVIVPIMLLFPFLSKMTGVQHRVQESSHYTAWERTVWKESQPSRLPSSGGVYLAKQTELELAKYLPWRFYQKNSQKINSEIDEGWDWEDKVHPLLKHQVSVNNVAKTVLASGQETPENNDEFDRFSREVRGGEVPGTLAGLVGNALSVLSVADFSLEQNQFYQAKVMTKLEHNYIKPFDELELEFSSNSALLASGWNAAGSSHMKNRIERLVLTNFMDNSVIRTAQDLVSVVPFAKELNSDSLKLGHVDPNILPNNRLCTYGTENCGG
ncbi:hypothetical protein [Shewanella frigidimarina]|uniref:Uncharacterized protein n=1 Tax=Shewanella frigidimarina TaxID=56812 RepID=A0A125BEE3_SHEFR|nr:hypothetical protein [Shewanella frigidimarina]KVX01523.1 hypothetical protein AWJ07_17445 [Shewanella frigidimarina]